MKNLSAHTEILSCPSHGEYTAKVLTVVNDKKITSKCPECANIAIARENDDKQKKKAYETAQLLEKACISMRFKSKTFDNYKTENEGSRKALKICQSYAESFPARFESGGGLVLCGSPGTGKTHLATAIIKFIIPKFDKSALFSSVMGITKKIKNTWARDAEETEAQAFKTFTTPSLLVIDELGAQFGTDAEKLILFELINDRYEKMLPTILISNLELSELKKFIGERVIDRMQEGGGAIIDFNWESYRPKI